MTFVLQYQSLPVDFDIAIQIWTKASRFSLLMMVIELSFVLTVRSRLPAYFILLPHACLGHTLHSVVQALRERKIR
jgi:hypothetical protein